MKNIDSRYTLVIVAAKRARRLIDGEPKMVDCNLKICNCCTYEIKEGKGL